MFLDNSSPISNFLHSDEWDENEPITTFSSYLMNAIILETVFNYFFENVFSFLSFKYKI